MTLEAVLREFDRFAERQANRGFWIQATPRLLTLARHRLEQGAEVYSADGFLKRGAKTLLRELAEEQADVLNYRFFLSLLEAKNSKGLKS